MIYLILAILLGSMFAILFKLFARKSLDTLLIITYSYMVSIYIGVFSVLASGDVPYDLKPFFLQAMITGGFMAGAFITMSQATLSHGVAVATISARMSFIIPVVCSYLIFHGDKPQWSIIALVLLSLFLIFYRREKNSPDSHQWLNPIFVFLCFGISNFMLKHLQQSVTAVGGGDKGLQFITAMAFGGAFMVAMFYTIKKRENTESNCTWREFVAAAILGGVNVGCTYFLMKALTVIDTSLLYPVYNIAIVTIVALVGRLCFGERLTAIQYGGIALAFLAIVLFFK